MYYNFIKYIIINYSQKSNDPALYELKQRYQELINARDGLIKSKELDTEKLSAMSIEKQKMENRLKYYNIF